MFFDITAIYLLPFIGIVLIIIGLSLSNTRNQLIPSIHMKRKQRSSISDIRNSPMTIRMNPLTTLENTKCIRNFMSIPLDDDEELIKLDISSKFCDNNSIELRLEQNLDIDNDMHDENYS